MKKIYRFSLCILLLLSLSFSLTAQNSFFAPMDESAVSFTNSSRVIIPAKYNTVKADMAQLKTFLWSLPSEKTVNTATAPIMQVPMPNGQTARFRVWETHIQAPELAAKFPTIKTFAGQGIDDPHATIWFDYGPRGFHGQVLSVNGSYYIDPYAVGNTTDYISYFRKDLMNNKGKWACDVPDYTPKAPGSNSLTAAACRGTEMRTYRLAVACTGEYAQAPGINAGNNATILHNAIVTSVNRVVGVYRTEVSVSMTLVATNNLVEFLDAATDPFTGNNNANVLINESQTVCDANIGSANYDIGHTFSTGGGGLAQLNSPCGSSKARGITGSPNPTGDPYDIDYVAHEMGHQFGGNHTMAGCGSSPANTKLETGSGTTIQAYAGICGAENIQPNSDPFFHAMSFDEISNFVSGAGAACGTTSATGNGIPVIGALTNNGASIPISTPFTLTGTATDPNNDPLTYCWEQWDVQGAQTWNAGATAAAGNTVPLFKSRIPKTTGSRTFPDMAVILAGYPANPPSAMGGLKGETLSPVARAMKFKLSVRDNRTVGGGYASSGSDGCQTNSVYQINVVNSGGPFAVTIPNGGESYAGGSTQTVTWNPVGTTAAPFSVANVRILLSTDGGLTYPTTIIASTPNDGSEAVTIPAGPTTTARVKVEAIGNVFFDISNANFSITGAPAAPTVTINQAAAQPDPTSASPINFTVVFNEAVTGFATGDVTLAGTAGATTATVTGGPTTYNVAVSGMASSGTVIATIPAGVCTSVATALANVASTSTDNTVTFNLVVAAPTVTINQAAAQADPTGTSPINFTVVFDQPVTGFATGDVTLSGTAGATTGTVTGAGTTYNVAVSGMTGSGTVIATVPANVAQNASAQGNLASTSTDNTVTYNAPVGCTSVNPVPNQTVCNNSPTAAVNFTSPTPGTTFSWVNNNTSIGLAANGTGNIPSFTATNPGATPNVATITVTPVLTTVTPTTTTFNFTGGAQTFTVPAGVTSLNITTLGAQGGSGATGGNGATGGVGGLGSRATGTLAVTPGQVLTIFVGGQGGAPTSGFNGGGTGGNANSGGGGGASDVRFPGATSADRILVAGGGGGGGRAGCEPNTVNGGAGGNGDGNGANGVNSPNGGGGFGAIGTTPGAAGIGCAGFLGSPGLAGFGPAGGNGGAGQSCCCFTFASVPGGGGGGGGFLGGAGGGGGSAGTTGCAGNDKGGGGGGAGGTSYTGGVTAGVITTGIQSGNGQVILNYNVTTVCNGPTTAFTITVLPTATVNPVPNQTVCAGSPTNPVNFTSATAGAIFNWTNNTPAIGLAASGTGNIPSFIAQNPGATPLTATITVTPSVPIGGGPCAGSAPQTFTNNTPVAIVDNAVVSSTVVVSGAPTYLLDVNLITAITHTFNADLDITITSPAGTVVTLTSDNAAGNDNVFNGTTWDDDANPGGQVPYTTNNGIATDHSYVNLTAATPLAPEEPLGAFIGENPNGTWTLRVSDDLGGDVGTINSWSVVVSGLAAAPTTANTSATNNTPVAIVDNAVVSSTINVSGAGSQLLDVNLTTFITHTFCADMDITITSPAGTVVTLTSDNGAGNDNVFNGTVWDDDANPGGQVPYTTNNGLASDHSYVNLTTATPLAPEEALAAFIGENPNGTWTLRVSDDLGGDVGTINSWTLNLQTMICSGFCVGTPTSFTITVNPNPAIVIIADPGTTLCEGDPTLLTVVQGTATGPGVLYTQGPGAPVNGSPSQVFEPANTAFNSQSADDFVVPAGSTWNITQMSFVGIGAGAPTSVNVFVYNNSGSNLPGTQVAAYNNLTSYTQAGGNYTVTLPSALSLSSGTYWVSMQVNMAFATGGQWFWGNYGAPTVGNQYAWQNPGGGFATPCTSWGYGGTGCNVGGGAANVNNIFSLTGTSVTGGASMPAGYTYLWSPATGLSSTTSNPVAASPMNTTTYTVVATGPGPAFCSRTASVTITVNKRPVVTTQPANTVRCAGTTATFTVGATGTGLTYQWQESLVGCTAPVWTNLTNGGQYSGVNAATLSISGVTTAMSGRGYRCIVTGVCAPWTPPTNVSNCATLTVNPLPVVSITPPISCGGVAGISGTALSVGSAPPPVPGSVTVNSGTINLTVPDNTANGVSNVIAMTGVPANATITNVAVTLNNFSHTYPGDMIIHLQAPNGQILNLYKYGTGLFTGPASGVPTWGWYGARVSQLGTTAWSTVATAPFIYNNSTPWRADAINTPVAGPVVQNPTGFVSNAPNFAALYTTPASTTGNWTLAMADGGPGDIGTLGSWSLTIEYTTPGSGGANNSYVWSPQAGLYTNSTATSPYTGQNLSTVYAAPSAFTVYTVTATDNVTGCTNTSQAFVNYTPPAPTVTPNPVAMCLGDAAVRLIASSATTTTTQFCSGPISVIVPDNNPGGATSNITVSGIPASCNVTAAAVTFNMPHTWAGDVAIALKAPNGQILNLDYYLSGTGAGPTTGFVNTKISSTGTAAIGSATSPFTGTFRADAAGAASAPPAGPTGFLPTTTSWTPLFANPNGVWTLAMVDGFGGDQGTLTSWCLDLTYVCGIPSTPATWSPIAGLFNDAAATIPYAGTPRDTVWTRPTPSGVYTYQATVQSLPVPPLTFTNSAPITINAAGNGNPYPANLVVSGIPPTGVTVKNVTLTGISHTWAEDVDIMLQSPSGQNVILLSDIAPGGADYVNHTYTFDDAAAGTMPTGATVPASGTYRPTNFVGAIGVEPDNWPAPGPGAVTQPTPTLSTFTGNMNGTWKLFVFDDAAGDQGTIAGGFSIGFDLGIAPCTSPARTVTVTVNDPTVLNAQLPANQTVCTDKVATFTAAVTAGTGPHSYQWQVSTNGGGTFANVANGGVYSGATTATLTITAPPVSMSTYQYR
ncbi:MAG: proprotein convertase P-domain-containing protein, partial [Ferruginibacter sp.]|nr:proprotein convertase P-domain-containing protein [Ferruginibacter sp.]